MTVLFKKLRADAVIPKRCTTHAAGFDMCAPERVVIEPDQTYWVESGVAMAIPEGYVGLIWPRSGLAYKFGADTLGGVIDADYRAEVKIGLINHGKQPIEIAAGERVCQLIVQPFVGDSDVVDELPAVSTNRTGGFGSTGRGAIPDADQPKRETPKPASLPKTQEEVQQSWAEHNQPNSK